MRRLARPAVFVGLSVGAIVGFVAMGRLGAERLDTHDVRGWLARADPVDALAEIARLLGLVLATYVAIVALIALLAEIAARVRMPRIYRSLCRLVGLVALPSLRRRLIELSTVAAVTVSSLHALPAGAASAGTPIALVTETAAPPAPHVAVRGEFHGFGVPAANAAAASSIDTHLVRKDETLSGIITNHYGRFDAGLLRLVTVANPQITDPNLILVGWIIALPDVPHAPAGTGAPTAPAPPTVRGEATWTVVTVQDGDTLWDIVDRHSGHATADLVWATVAANPGLEHPNLIYPGQQITLPPNVNLIPLAAPANDPEPVAPPTTAVPPATATSPPTPASSPAVTTSPSTTAPGASGNDESSAPRPFLPPPLPATASSAPPTPAPIGSVVQAPPPVRGGAHLAAQGTATLDETGWPSLEQLIGWSGGASLAAALLGLATRRRRRHPLGERVGRPSKRAVELGVALRETQNLSSVEWAAGALRTLAARLRPRPGEPTPVPRLLRLADDNIELVWDTPNVESAAPWHTPDGGWSWTLARTNDLSTPENPNPCPCLVTIGRHAGADVLLNLESCGAIAITGDPDVAGRLWKSMATELSCSPFSDCPTVLLVGVDDLAGQPDHARIVDLPEALAWLRDRTEAAGAVLAHRRLTSLFALRARSRPHDGHEPVVVVVDSGGVPDDDVAALVNLANGDLGAVVIVAGPEPLATWQLRCRTDTVEVEPLGLVLEPVGLDPSLEAVVNALILDPEDAEDEITDEGSGEEGAGTPELELVLADHLQLVQVHQENVAPEPAEPETSDDQDWDVELKVLGQVRSIGTKRPLTPTELHLAIYMAFHRNGENSDTISTMVWPNGAAARTLTNAMASLRRKLGTGSDGEMLFPLGRDNQYVYRLSPRVVTDWDRFIALARRSESLPEDEAVEVLDHALQIVDGPPFRAASGYSWAYSDGTATLMTETIKAVARRCVDLHLQRAELVEAGTAASAAARAVDAGVDDPLIARVVQAFERAGEDTNATAFSAISLREERRS